ncbi:hypothetical protein F4680DRAFT_347287 [Xylaria scruposa]|nr:hypothetical protein F4680DRAFT_347287 [Xylaria scruposa]
MSIASKDVYTGMWTDWSKGNQVLGSTITITSSASTLLTAFLALYVSLAVSYLWLLIAYGIHRARYAVSTGKCRAIIRQQEVILKAGLSPTSTSVRLIKLYWAYRSKTLAWHESWLLIAIAVLCAVSSAAAGIFSSRIIDSSIGINVLLRSPQCGFFNPASVNFFDIDDPAVVAQNRAYQEILSIATTYSRSCYNSTSDNGQCGTFSSATIPWRTDWEANCPFGDMCIGPAMSLDTGFINSNTILGLNSPMKDQIGLRKITTCAPIVQEGFTTQEPAALPGDHFVTYHYGAAARENTTWRTSVEAANTTKSYTIAEQSYYSGAWANISGWIPDPEFNNTHGDGTLFFLSSNNLAFTEPCDDPVFSAHIPSTYLNSTVYLEDNISGVLGCLEQVQWCNPTNTTCSIVGGLGDVYVQVTEELPLNKMQVAIADMITFIFNRYAGISSKAGHNPPDLVASESLSRNVQLPLPRNQWQIEIQDWHATTLSLIQYGILQWMIGPSDSTLQKYVQPPPTPEQQALCRRQRVHISQGFANVSSFGLFLTVSVGAVVILLAVFLDSMVACTIRLTKGNQECHRAWKLSDVLHLQRLAYSKQCLSKWVATEEDIPLVEGNGFLEPLVGFDNY